ncbi:MAG: ABC transporter ATP-binding protein/permease [Actinomycetota bacterium]|nr:ABC transporter ATP-binding protein/permease [Actinomycetota bacterium]
MEQPIYRLPRREMTIIVVLAITQAVSLGATLLLLREVVDLLSGDLQRGSEIAPQVGLLGLALGINTFARAVEFTVSEQLGYEVARQLRLRMYEHLQGMSIEQLEHRSRGGLLLRFTGDLSMLRTWISRGIGRGLVSAIVLVGGLGVVAVLSLRLALAIAAVLCFGAAASSWLGPGLRQETRWVRRKRSLLTGNIDEQVSSLAVVQVFGRSRGELSRLSRQNDSLTRSLFRTATIRGRLLGISTATGSLALVAVLAVGAGDVAAGRTSVGVIVAAIIAARHLAGPVRRIGLSYDYWQRAQVSRRKISEFLRSSSRPLDAPGLPPLRVRRGALELSSVHVDGALEEISASVTGGQVIAITGPTGAGKSTLLKVVAGLVEPDRGRITIDGNDVADHSLSSRLRHVGMVSPDLGFMRGSVRRNLTYRKPRATDEELQRVILTCHLDTLLDGLPEGIDYWLVEGGRNLSVGERQRVALGRAVMGNPPILLLDEPTVNLDAANREIVRRVIAQHQGTILLVTHDPQEAALADQVWFMRGGRLVDVISGRELRDRQWAASSGARAR